MPSSAATKTFADAIDATYSVLKEEVGVSNYPLSLIIDYCNVAQNMVCDGTLTDFDNPPLACVKPFLNFLASRAMFTTVNPRPLSVAPTVGGNVLDLPDTSAYTTTGAVWIYGNIVTYTGKTATQLTGCSGILFAHDAGSPVMQAYALPTDFGTSDRLTIDGVAVVRTVDQRDIVKELYGEGWYRSPVQSLTGMTAAFSFQKTEPKYSILDGRWFLPFPVYMDARPLMLEYQRFPTQYATSATLLTVPDGYSLRVISTIAASEMLFQRAEMDSAQKLRVAAINATSSMYRAFAYANRETANGQRMRSAQDSRTLNV